MNTKTAFLNATTSLATGFHEISCYRVLGNTLVISIIGVHVRNREEYKGNQPKAVSQLQHIKPDEFSAFLKVFGESFLAFSHSWLESYLDEVEEVLFLHSPELIGESVPVKLGKLLEVKSIDELVHDLVRKKIRDRGQWSLKNRLEDLTTKNNFTFQCSAEDLHWISELRNTIVHDRSAGRFSLKGKKLSFAALEKRDAVKHEIIDRYLGIVTTTISDLYFGTCNVLKVSPRNKVHQKNSSLMSAIVNAYKKDA
jgi:hypothetical protein